MFDDKELILYLYHIQAIAYNMGNSAAVITAVLLNYYIDFIQQLQ